MGVGLSLPCSHWQQPFADPYQPQKISSPCETRSVLSAHGHHFLFVTLRSPKVALKAAIVNWASKALNELNSRLGDLF